VIFTIGSACFLFADIKEWLLNNHVGCCCDAEQRGEYENTIGKHLNSNFDKAINGINFFYSAIGSFLYLIGSIYYIPQANNVVLGTTIFIYGSIIIFTSQCWKLYRAGCVYTNQDGVGSFNISNLSNDISASFTDLFAGIGALFYLIGNKYNIIIILFLFINLKFKYIYLFLF
jgi:hypothetical protein